MLMISVPGGGGGIVCSVMSVHLELLCSSFYRSKDVHL